MTETAPSYARLFQRSKGFLRRRFIPIVWDSSAWASAVILATILRYEGIPIQPVQAATILLAICAALAQVVFGILLHLYRGRYLPGSFDEVYGVALTAGLVTLVLVFVRFFFQSPGASRSVPFIAGAIALPLLLMPRYIRRRYGLRSTNSEHGKRTLIYGAGETGAQILQQMLRQKGSDFLPIGFLDDDDRKGNLRILNYRILGKRSDLDAVIAREHIEVVVVAIAQVDGKVLREIDEKCQAHGSVLRVIPRLSEIVAGTVGLGDVSTVTEEDLLGRRPVDINEESIASLVGNMRVLITGAGGSIGSELSRQVARFSPSALVLLDRDESALHSVQISLDGRGLLDSDNLVLADIRDGAYVTEILKRHSPDIVFHAAALKHLTLLERNPHEAVKTNVEGTRNVITAAYEAGVPTFINISTDKAADPTSVLGRSKRRTEEITSQMPDSLPDGTPTRYLSVRFGNVLGSRGSFLTAFRHQIERGGPVTVTHPEVSRYFMTIPEAVRLVLEASRIGGSGDVLVLDMGDPVRIDEVAKYMIRKSGKTVSIEYTGLRAGEKLHEDLIGKGEFSEESDHPLIHRIVRTLGNDDRASSSTPFEEIVSPATYEQQSPGQRTGGS